MVICEMNSGRAAKRGTRLLIRRDIGKSSPVQRLSGGNSRLGSVRISSRFPRSFMISLRESSNLCLRREAQFFYVGYVPDEIKRRSITLGSDGDSILSEKVPANARSETFLRKLRFICIAPARMLQECTVEY